MLETKANKLNPIIVVRRPILSKKVNPICFFRMANKDGGPEGQDYFIINVDFSFDIGLSVCRRIAFGFVTLRHFVTLITHLLDEN